MGAGREERIGCDLRLGDDEGTAAGRRHEQREQRRDERGAGQHPEGVGEAGLGGQAVGAGGGGDDALTTAVPMEPPMVRMLAFMPLAAPVCDGRHAPATIRLAIAA